MATTKKTATKAKKASKQAKPRTAGTSRRKKKTETKAKSPKEAEVTIDRRRKNRRKEETDAPASESAPAIERREKVQRRRQIDPTTCERDYTEQEVEFMNAMDHYKRTSGRMFPTCSEVLEVIRDLGYVQLSSAQRTALGLTTDDSPELEEGAGEEAEQQALEAGAM